MPGQKSIAFEKKVLDCALGGQSITSPGTAYFALFTVNPSTLTDSATEVTGGSYARVAVTNNLTNFPAAALTATPVPAHTPCTKSNAFNILFPAATASWGLITGFGIYDALSGGTLYYWGSIPTVAINSGTHYQILATALTLTET